MPFQETQKFSPKIIWAMRVLALSLAGLFIFLYLQNLLSGPFLGCLILFGVLPALALEVFTLRTKLDKTGINVNLSPLSKRHFDWSDIQSAEVLDYGFVGGWGLRLGTKYGTVYNMRGREGVWLKLKSGKNYLIGTQRKAALQQALKTHFTSG